MSFVKALAGLTQTQKRVFGAVVAVSSGCGAALMAQSYAIQQSQSITLERLDRPAGGTTTIGGSTAEFASKSKTPEGDCDCLPLWNCMQDESKPDCTVLENRLKSCMINLKTSTPESA